MKTSLHTCPLLSGQGMRTFCFMPTAFWTSNEDFVLHASCRRLCSLDYGGTVGNQSQVARQRSQQIYCQGGSRKSASLVQIIKDALTSHIGCQLLPCNPHFGDSGSFNFKCHGHQLAPNMCSLGGGSVLSAMVASWHPTCATLVEGRSKCHGRQLAPNRSTLGGGSVWDVVVQPNPAGLLWVALPGGCWCIHIQVD